MLDLDRFFPYYQPIVDVVSGRIGGYEALARYRTPNGSIISAWPFFSDENVGNQDKLAVDRHVRAAAIATFATRHGVEFLCLNISPSLLSGYQEGEQPLGEMTIGMLDELDIPRGAVIAEIQESDGEHAAVVQMTKRFHGAGLRVAIDDFGAGHSHMERLFELKPDYLKIDMNLFRLAARGGVRADYLQALRYVTERNDIKVICEGVETETEFMFAMDCGARYIQGFLFSPATPIMLPPDAFSAQVAALREAYLRRKTDRLIESSRRRNAIEAVISDIRQHILSDDFTVELEQLRRLGIFRFYACNKNGAQVSSNYNILDKLTLDRHFQGHNWSTRPYFSELIALNATANNGTGIVCSSAYKDVERQLLCRTYGIAIDEEHMLFVDASEDDMITYVRPDTLELN